MSSQHFSQSRSLPLWLGFVLLAEVLFCRLPGTPFVFDEQEAVLFNPYLQADLPFSSAWRLDFWGRPASASIGSYRPVPNLVWRTVLELTSASGPLSLVVLGPLLHGTNAFLLRGLLLRWKASEATALLSGLLFLSAGVCVEAVSNIVGLADLLVASATLLSLHALFLGAGLRELAIFFLCLLGLLSKETMLVAMLPVALGLFAMPRALAGHRVARFATLTFVMGLSLSAFLLIRRSMFLTLPEPESAALRAVIPELSPLLAWIGQPSLPLELLNNPLIGSSPGVHIATALRIALANVTQMLIPYHLCADYSFPRIVPSGFDLAALGGGLLLLLPFALVLVRRRTPARGTDSLSLVEYGLLFMSLTMLPLANLGVFLPTIRAERLLYLPLLGVVIALSVGLLRWASRPWGRRLVVFLLAVSALSARAHALHYQSDVLFWRAATLGTPASAKAHLNLGVSLGARGDEEGRLRQVRRAVALAPKWGLAHVYLGDALCRGAAPEAALPHYLRGLAISPNSRALAALSLQCLWVKREFERAYDPLKRVAARAEGGWLDYLLEQVAQHGDENGGVPPAYRAPGYDQPLGRSSQ